MTTFKILIFLSDMSPDQNQSEIFDVFETIYLTYILKEWKQSGHFENNKHSNLSIYNNWPFKIRIF